MGTGPQVQPWKCTQNLQLLVSDLTHSPILVFYIGPHLARQSVLDYPHPQLGWEEADTDANFVAKYFLALPIWRDIFELTQANNLTSANIVKDHSPFHPIFKDMSETFTTRRNPSNVPSVTGALASKPTWTGTWRNMKTAQTHPQLWTVLKARGLKKKATLMKSEVLWERWHQQMELVTTPPHTIQIKT